jgi:hypothetical protein
MEDMLYDGTTLNEAGNARLTLRIKYNAGATNGGWLHLCDDSATAAATKARAVVTLYVQATHTHSHLSSGPGSRCVS